MHSVGKQLLAIVGLVLGFGLWGCSQTPTAIKDEPMAATSTLDLGATAQAESFLSATETTRASLPPSPTPVVKLPYNAPVSASVIEPDVKPGMLNNDNWTLFTDLNRVFDIAIDREGYIWSAGSGGVVRWNPVEATYTKYTLQNGLKQNQIAALVAAPNGAMWFLSDHYLSSFHAGQWSYYESPTRGYWSKLAVTPDGDVWIGTIGPKGTGDGVYRFNGQGWSHHLAPEPDSHGNDIYAIAATSKGAVLAAMEGGVMLFDGQRWIHTDHQGYNIAVAPDGEIWIVGDMATRIDDTGRHTFPIPDKVEVSAIAASHHGILWLRTSEGIVRFDGSNWTPCPLPDGVTGDDILALVSDSQGGVWVGTTQGLAHFDGSAWRIYKVEESPSSVNDIAAATDGSVWVGTDKGASRFDGKTWRNYTIADSLTDNVIWGIETTSTGQVWLNPSHALSSFDGITWTHYPQVDLTASSFAVSPDGKVWLALRNDPTLYLFDGKNLSAYSPGFKWVYDITIAPNGVAWFGIDNGVAQFDGKNWVAYLDDKFGTSITTVAVAPDGTLWGGGYGSYGYLTHFDGASWTIYKLPGEAVRSVTISPNGDVWALLDILGKTQNGVTPVQSTVIRFAQGAWASFELEKLEVRGRKIVAASDGSVWVETESDSGILRIKMPGSSASNQ